MKDKNLIPLGDRFVHRKANLYQWALSGANNTYSNWCLKIDMRIYQGFLGIKKINNVKSIAMGECRGP